MSYIPVDLKYVDSHEWLRVEENGEYTVGVTEHAQSLLGDVVFVELPEVGSEFEQGNDAGVVESVKAASDVYSPIKGTITAINSELEDTPELINSDPYGDGWIFRIMPDGEPDNLLDADAYSELCSDEG
ncbi:glycine cleavage system protein GcvH [Pelagibaculum spongiae]|uniref:Glycine cleavage system H protein n=1 Tax=Pelagibaculum spongiae TaxID=2080658 RepID=A0A2V1H507_9GAMM|nr:glycine cleavage system protein GcvH [Pelagibaculum spongiae]PVZ72287.1 glycine cleavage system protein GcvH [Pelagibaculum spongiae]